MMNTTLKMYFLEIHLQEETVSEMYRDCQISSEVIFLSKATPKSLVPANKNMQYLSITSLLTELAFLIS